MNKKLNTSGLFFLLAVIILLAGVGIERYRRNQIPVEKMLIVGDSIGAGTGVGDYELKWYKFLPPFMEEKYNVKLDITNVSMGGNTSFAGYSRIMNLEEGSFDYVVVCYGENDRVEDFSLYYECILRAVYWRYPDSRIITILESSQREYTEKIETIKELSKHYNTQIVDTIAAFNNSGIAYEELAEDGTHPNEKGQQIYYEAVKDVLIKIHSEDKREDAREILPINEEVEEFRNFELYGADEFQQASENELVLELTEVTARLGIYYTPVEGTNHIELYADDVLVLDKEFEWEHSFVQDYIELADRQKVKFSKMRVVFDKGEQRDNFQGVVLVGMTDR